MAKGRDTISDGLPIETLSKYPMWDLRQLGISEDQVMLIVPVEDLIEQDINARVMQPAMYNQFVGNVKEEEALESVPFCALTEKGLEIVSGHHRVRAARSAGLKKVPILLNIAGLDKSQIRSKQIAHNSISGFDDMDTLRQMVREIDSPEDLVRAFLPPEILKELEIGDLESLLGPRIDIDWKTVVLAFLPHQMQRFRDFLDLLEEAEVVAAVPLDCYERFAKAVTEYQRFKNVTNAGMAVSYMVEVAMRHLARYARLKQVQEDRKNEESSAKTGQNARGMRK